MENTLTRLIREAIYKKLLGEQYPKTFDEKHPKLSKGDCFVLTKYPSKEVPLNFPLEVVKKDYFQLSLTAKGISDGKTYVVYFDAAVADPKGTQWKKIDKPTEVDEASVTGSGESYATPKAFGKTGDTPKGYTKAKETHKVFKKLDETIEPYEKILNSALKLVNTKYDIKQIKSILISDKGNYIIKLKDNNSVKINSKTIPGNIMDQLIQKYGIKITNNESNLDEKTKLNIMPGEKEKEFNIGVRNLNTAMDDPELINYGGCGAVAKLLYYAIRKNFNVEPKIIALLGPNYGSSSTPSLDNYNSMREYMNASDRGVHHIIIKVGDYYIDSDGIKKHYPFDDYRADKLMPMKIQTLTKWVKNSEGWNPSFNRTNIPNLAKYIDKLMNKLKSLNVDPNKTNNDSTKIK